MKNSILVFATKATCLMTLSIAVGIVFVWAISSPNVTSILASSSIEGREVISRHADRTDHGTLSFVLSTDCRYCEKSMDFYKSLLGSRTAKDFMAIALFQEPKPVSMKYLRDHDIEFDEVYQVKFDDLDIVGTPTLLLVDSNGEIVGRWVGILSESRKQELLRLLTTARRSSEPSEVDTVVQKY